MYIKEKNFAKKKKTKKFNSSISINKNPYMKTQSTRES